MALPLPKNCRLNETDRWVDFEVEIDGRKWKAFITFPALDAIYPGRDRIAAVSRSAYIARKLAECIRAGNNEEPIALTSMMFPL